MAQATHDSSNTTPTPQTTVDLQALAERLEAHANAIENVAAKPMADDMRLAAMALNRLVIEIRKAASSTNDAISKLVEHVGGQ